MENIQVDTSFGDYTNRWANFVIIILALPNPPCATKLLGTSMPNSLPLNCKLCQIPDLIHLSVFPHNIILVGILFCKCYNFSKLSPVCLSIHSIRFYDFPTYQSCDRWQDIMVHKKYICFHLSLHFQSRVREKY